MKKFIYTVIILLICMIPCGVEAKTYEILVTGDYAMLDNDSKQYAEQEAIKDAMRAAISKAGVYVRAYSKTRNNMIVEDQVEAIAQASLKNVKYRSDFYTENREEHCQVVLSATVNTDDFSKAATETKSVQDPSEPDIFKGDTDRYQERLKRPMGVDQSQPYTCLVLDCRSLPLPGGEEEIDFRYNSDVLDTTGKEIYSFSKLSYEKQFEVRGCSIARVITGYNQHKLLKGKNPLIVKPIKIQAAIAKDGTKVLDNIIVSVSDGKKILAENRKTGFLGNMYVNIIQ